MTQVNNAEVSHPQTFNFTRPSWLCQNFSVGVTGRQTTLAGGVEQWLSVPAFLVGRFFC